ncbi:FaeA/PapI family transcriptional regulator [Halorubellus litoreus]|uniref:FaeA/PapI family transcriptional regulator n=1 Tax=Halorubellus litoreus TaxID=755308 RepID=A0ABD5VF33_9EURY
MGDSKPGRKPRVTDEEILAVFEETDDPVLSTAEVADALPLQRRSVYNRLVQLEEAGQLTRKQIGGRNTIWWLSD